MWGQRCRLLIVSNKLEHPIMHFGSRKNFLRAWIIGIETEREKAKKKIFENDFSSRSDVWKFKFKFN